MAKTYPDELAEWVEGRAMKKSRQDKHVVAFLAVRTDVQAGLEAGYAMKTIWEHMRETGRLQYRYETFTQHVKRHIKARQDSPPVPGPASAGQAHVGGSEPATSAPHRAPKREPAKIGGFTYDATPNKEDLL